MLQWKAWTWTWTEDLNSEDSDWGLRLRTSTEDCILRYSLLGASEVSLKFVWCMCWGGCVNLWTWGFVSGPSFSILETTFWPRNRGMFIIFEILKFSVNSHSLVEYWAENSQNILYTVSWWFIIHNFYFKIDKHLNFLKTEFSKKHIFTKFNFWIFLNF